ncbi:MAG: hypothetical protein ACP5E5_02015 [Acidobacteriaceae bacterium]
MPQTVRLADGTQVARPWQSRTLALTSSSRSSPSTPGSLIPPCHTKEGFLVIRLQLREHGSVLADLKLQLHAPLHQQIDLPQTLHQQSPVLRNAAGIQTAAGQSRIETHQPAHLAAHSLRSRTHGITPSAAGAGSGAPVRKYLRANFNLTRLSP